MLEAIFSCLFLVQKSRTGSFLNGRLSTVKMGVGESVFFRCQIPTPSTSTCESSILGYIQGYVYFLPIVAGEEEFLTQS